MGPIKCIIAALCISISTELVNSDKLSEISKISEDIQSAIGKPLLLTETSKIKWTFGSSSSRSKKNIGKDLDKKEIIRKYFDLYKRKRSGLSGQSGQKSSVTSFPTSFSVGHLGRSCSSTGKDCRKDFGQVCEKGTCRCASYHVRHNDTHCLPGVLLGFGCVAHSQCQIRVPDSSCVQGFCQCGAGKVPYRRANCLKVSSVGDSCRIDSQCSFGAPGSYCQWIVRNVLGKCRCKMETSERVGKCQSPGFALGAPCGKSLDCAQHVPGSICVNSMLYEEKEPQFFNLVSQSPVRNPSYMKKTKLGRNTKEFGGICQCPKHYFALVNGTRCVPVQKDVGILPVSLGKRCLLSSQCEASDPFSFCSEGFCDCSVPNTPCSRFSPGCHKETFQCNSDGRCISLNYVCDGKWDCNDGSDEASCSSGACPQGAFTCGDGGCIPRGHVCDGVRHCLDGADEEKCGGIGACPPTSFECRDRSCVPGFELCNAVTNCADGSDEDVGSCVQGRLRGPDCPFRCKNGRCRSTAIVCSGRNGCGDNSDEENCAVCNCPRPPR